MFSSLVIFLMLIKIKILHFCRYLGRMFNFTIFIVKDLSLISTNYCKYQKIVVILEYKKQLTKFRHGVVNPYNSKNLKFKAPKWSGWLSGLRRCAQVTFHFSGRGFNSHFWPQNILVLQQTLSLSWCGFELMIDRYSI